MNCVEQRRSRKERRAGEQRKNFSLPILTFWFETFLLGKVTLPASVTSKQSLKTAAVSNEQNAANASTKQLPFEETYCVCFLQNLRKNNEVILLKHTICHRNLFRKKGI